MTAFATIQTASDNGIFSITLNRPGALNALTDAMSTEITAALRMAERDDAVRSVILTGAGRAFCSGQDLKVLADPPGDPGGDEPYVAGLLRQHYNPLIARMRTMEKPVVAALNGVAAGAGASLALAADLRIAARSASLMMAFVHVGLVPDMGSTLTLVQHAGYARAAELCFLGEPLTADEALRCGLVNRVVADDELPAAAREWAGRLAALPTRAIGLTKRALNRAWAATLDEQLEREASLQAAAAQTADHLEGLQAFLAKRKPKFAGK